MKIRLFLLSAFLFSTIDSSNAAPAKCLSSNAAYVHNLDKVYKAGDVRVFYTTDKFKNDAVRNLTDLNKNNIPDYVEDMATQLQVSREAFNELGFRDILQSPRYKGVVTKIDIHLVHMTGNGSAIEVAYRYPKIKLKGNECALILKINANLENFPGTWSIATHELFHLYQYSYTQIKRSWLLEASTNWAERVIRKGAVKNHTVKLPQTLKDTEKEVFSVNYNRAWDRIAYLADTKKEKIKLSSKLTSRKYVNNSIVIRDDLFWGKEFIVKLYENLEYYSDKITVDKKLPQYAWKEIDQRDPSLDAYIILAIQKTLKELKVSNKEIDNFLNVNIRSMK